jgi:hypothetical protein
VTEAQCPFCEVAIDALPAPPGVPGRRLSRAALFAFAASVGVAGCRSTSTPDSGTATNVPNEADAMSMVALYGAPMPTDLDASAVMATPTATPDATPAQTADSTPPEDTSATQDAPADSMSQDASPRRPRRPPRTGVSLPVTTIQVRYGAPPAPDAWS